MPPLTKLRGIILSASEVTGLQSGTLTQLRRVIPARTLRTFKAAAQIGEISDFVETGVLAKNDASYILDFASYQVGQILYVKETFWSRHDTDSDGYKTIDCGPYLDGGAEYCPGWDYCASPEYFNPPTPEFDQTVSLNEGKPIPGNWWLAPPEKWDGSDEDRIQRGTWVFLEWDLFTKHPSVHMPQWASRLSIQITGVEVIHTTDWEWRYTVQRVES